MPIREPHIHKHSSSLVMKYISLSTFTNSFSNFVSGPYLGDIFSPRVGTGPFDSRGLDIADVRYVVNYGMPLALEAYVHRIGRCGRAGAF